MQLAGRWLNQATLNPIASGLGVGAATAGAATLGNVLSGEAGREGGGRVTLEALGAGALGGALGAYMQEDSKENLGKMSLQRLPNKQAIKLIKEE